MLTSLLTSLQYFHDRINEAHYPDAKSLPYNPSLSSVKSLLSSSNLTLDELSHEIQRVFDTAQTFFKERNPHLSAAAKTCLEAFKEEVRKVKERQRRQEGSATPPPAKRVKPNEPSHPGR